MANRVSLLALVLACGCSDTKVVAPGTPPQVDLTAPVHVVPTPGDSVGDDAIRTIEAGRQTFRYDTFGDEAFWGDTLKLNQAIAGVANGGVGVGVSPNTALAVGLKVDMDVLPHDLVVAIQAGKVDLDDPAVTLTLLKLGAVIGVTGMFDNNQLQSVGIQCALCHSTVDDAFAPGIGHRRDGWANRDLNVGVIIALAPDLSAIASLLGVSQDTVRDVLRSWGPGKFDAELILDGRAFRPDGTTAATLIPPAFGQAGIALQTWTGWGTTTYWNAFVANLEMHGVGNFFDPRLDDAAKFPIAARARFGHVHHDEDMITPMLPALHFFQQALRPPRPAPDSYDHEAAARGDALFGGRARCTSCHFDELYVEAGWPMHTAAELGIDDFQASRSPDDRYRTAPLHALFTHTKGGFYHDGRFATLLDVVDHYDTVMHLELSEQDKSDVVEYLKSL